MHPVKVSPELRVGHDAYQIEDRWFVWAPDPTVALALIEQHVGHPIDNPEVRYVGVLRPVAADGETWKRYAIRSTTQEVHA